MNFLRKKKNLTLVLGGTGKTGRRVAERLKVKGHEVRKFYAHYSICFANIHEHTLAPKQNCNIVLTVEKG